MYDPVYSWVGPPRIEVQRAAVSDPEGSSYISHRVMVQNGTAGAVIIAHREGAVVLVKSHRPAVGEELWEFPRGFGEAKDGARHCGTVPPESAALVATGLRELYEETGLTAVTACVLGVYVVDPSIYPARVGVIWAEVNNTESAETDGEIEDVMWVQLSSLPALITSGTLSDAHTLAAYAIFRSSNQNESF